MMKTAAARSNRSRMARCRVVACAISLALVTAAALLLPGCGSREPTGAKAHKGALHHYRLGAGKYREGDFEAAIRIYEKALQLNPNLALAHLDLGIIHDDYRSDKEKAIFHYNEYLRLEPQSEKADMVARWIHSAEEERTAGGGARPASNRDLQGGTAESAGVDADLRQARQDIDDLRAENDAYLKTVEALREELSRAKAQTGAASAGSAQDAEEEKEPPGARAVEEEGGLDLLTRSLESEKVRLWEKFKNEKGRYEKAVEVLKREIASLQAQKRASDEALKKNNERFESLKKAVSEKRGQQPGDESVRQSLSLANEKVAELQRENALYLKDNRALLARMKRAEAELGKYRAKEGSGTGAQPQLTSGMAHLIAKAKADGEKEKEELRQLYEKKIADLTNASAREKIELQRALAGAQQAVSLAQAQSAKGSSGTQAAVDSTKFVARAKADAEKEELRLRYEKRLAELSGSLGREKVGVQTELSGARREALFFKAQVEREREKTGRSEKIYADALKKLKEQHWRETAEMEQRFRREKETLLSRIAAAQRESPAARTIPSQPRSPVQAVGSVPQKSAGPKTQRSAAKAPVRRYRVARGDSLRTIALRFYGSADRWRIIYDANRRTLSGPNPTLRPGNILLIP